MSRRGLEARSHEGNVLICTRASRRYESIGEGRDGVEDIHVDFRGARSYRARASCGVATPAKRSGNREEINHGPRARFGTPAGAMSTYVYVDGEDAFARGRPGGRMAVQRRTVDYTATTVRHVEVRARSRWRSRAKNSIAADNP